MDPSKTVMGGRTSTHDMAIDLNRNGIRFWINVLDTDLKGCYIEDVYVRAKDQINSDQEKYSKGWELLCDIVLAGCLPLLEELAPAGKDFLTLNDYWQTPSYTLRLKCKDGTASLEIESGPMNKPTYYLVSRPELLLDTLDSIPLVPASNLSAIRGTKSLRTLPTKVRDERESRTPPLTGIVVADDGAAATGLLFIWVSDSTLADTDRRIDIKNHEKWKRQVVDAVAVLHGHDFVWGAVSPYNILIDEADDAFIQGLGLMYDSHLVDKDIGGTKAGDLECSRLLFDEWLVAQKPWRPMSDWRV